MTGRLRAKFDGKVLVPEGPVDLPRGQMIELRVENPLPEHLAGQGQPVRPVPDEPARAPTIGEALLQFLETQPRLDRGGLPADGSINYKHYLYGHPKVPVPGQDPDAADGSSDSTGSP